MCGCDGNEEKIASSSLGLWGLRTSSCGGALCCAPRGIAALLRCTAGLGAAGGVSPAAGAAGGSEKHPWASDTF